MGILLTISDLLIPVTVLCIVVFGCLQRMDIYEVFLEGAKEVRLVSSSAATGLLTDLFAEYGPDSFLGRTASVMMSCTETVFYTMSLYFLSVGIRKTRYTLPCALLANLVGIFAAVALVRLVF